MFFGSQTISEQAVRAALGNLRVPSTGKRVDEAGLLDGVVIEGARVRFVFKLDNAADMEALKAQSEAAVRAIKGVKEATAIFTAANAAPQAHGHGHGHHGRPGPQPKKDFSHLGKVIAVLSGKGGVGKSTVAANLAVALAKQNLRVGLLDADVYGPSAPKLFGITEKPKTENKKLLPIEKFGVKVMSIGFMLDEGAPVVWRGLMVQRAIQQLLEDVNWGQLDALVIDMPPGTGDVQLTLAQCLELAGGMIVSTPQDLALIDARKAIAMLQKMGVAILGVIENMSSFICPHCQTESHIFSHGGAAAEAQKIGAPFLGEVPLEMALRETSDAGTPIVVAAPDSKPAAVFMRVGQQVWDRLNAAPALKTAP